MIEIYFNTIRDEEFKRIEEVRAGCWLYVQNATLDDLSKIAELTSLEIADIRDSLDKHEIPRIESHGNTILFFTRHPGEGEPGLYTEPLTIILTDSYLVAISPTNSHIIDAILKMHLHIATTQKSKLLLYILLRITQEFTNSIKHARHAILLHEEGKIDSKAIFTLTKNEEILNQYLTSLVPMRNLLEALSTERYLNLYEKDLDLLHDLMIAIHQSEDLCRVNVKSIRSLRDSYQIIFTNDVNKTIKRLTALTIIFSIPTMMASIYGMNVALPIQNNPYAFPIVMGFAGTTCLTAIILFLKNRWL
jgi:magnesium transporter